jgi:hypothetical protein
MGPEDKRILQIQLADSTDFFKESTLKGNTRWRKEEEV